MSKRIGMDYIPMPITDSKRCCYYCENAYEEEGIDDTWWLYCSCLIDNEDGSMVFPSDCCEKFIEYKRQ